MLNASDIWQVLSTNLGATEWTDLDAVYELISTHCSLDDEDRGQVCRGSDRQQG